MNEQLNEWMHEWINGWINRWMDEWVENALIHCDLHLVDQRSTLSNLFIMLPTSVGSRGIIKWWPVSVCPSVGESVCLSVYRMPRSNSRSERPRKPKIGRMDEGLEAITRVMLPDDGSRSLIIFIYFIYLFFNLWASAEVCAYTTFVF